MYLRNRLTAAVLSSVHAVGHQCDGRRIDHMDRPLEAAGQTTVTTGWIEARFQRLEVPRTLQYKSFHHVAVAVFVGMRELIAAWRNRTANHSKFGLVVLKAVTDIVQPNRVRQLRE